MNQRERMTLLIKATFLSMWQKAITVAVAIAGTLRPASSLLMMWGRYTEHPNAEVEPQQPIASIHNSFEKPIEPIYNSQLERHELFKCSLICKYRFY